MRSNFELEAIISLLNKKIQQDKDLILEKSKIEEIFVDKFEKRKVELSRQFCLEAAKKRHPYFKRSTK